MTNDEGASPPSTFHQLLLQLQEEHRREVRELRREVKKLRARLGEEALYGSGKGSAELASDEGTASLATASVASLSKREDVGLRLSPRSEGRPSAASGESAAEALDGKRSSRSRPERRVTVNSNGSGAKPTRRPSFTDRAASFFGGSARRSSRLDTHPTPMLARKSLRSSAADEANALVSEMFQLYPEWVQAGQDATSFSSSMMVSSQASLAAKFQKMQSGEYNLARRMATKRDLGKRKWSFIKAPESKFILWPNSSFRLAWDLLGFTVLAFDLAWIPMQVFQPPDDNTFIFALEMATLAYWSLDIGLNFMTGFYKKDGTLVQKRRQIAARYLKGWFSLDIILVSNDWIMLSLAQIHEDTSASSASFARIAKIARVARTMRAVRLLRLLKLRELVFAVQERINSEWLLILYGMVQNVVVLVAVNHIIACVWYWLGSADQPDTWVLFHHMEASTFGLRYTTSMHWSLTQFTPASMEVFPRNVAERAFACCTLLFSMITFSSFLASITSSMTRLRGLKASKLSQYIMLRKFLAENAISPHLAARITRYVDLAAEIHQKRTDRRKVDLLEYLSGPLRLQLQKELFEQDLQKHEFFMEYSQPHDAAINHLCSVAIDKNFYSKFDCVFECSVRATHMYFVSAGSLDYRRMRGLKGPARHVQLVKSCYFTEPVLWTPFVHCGAAKALVESEVVQLDSKKFRDVTAAHPEVLLMSYDYAKQYVASLIQTTQEGRHIFDVPTELMYPEARTSARSRKSARHRPSELVEAEIVEAAFMSSDGSSSDDEDIDRLGAQERMALQLSCVRRLSADAPGGPGNPAVLSWGSERQSLSSYDVGNGAKPRKSIASAEAAVIMSM